MSDPLSPRAEPKKFLSQARHDLRTPINAIIGYGELLLEEAADDPGSLDANELEALLTVGRELLARVNGLVGEGQADRCADGRQRVGLAQALRTELAGPARAVVERAEGLGAVAGALAVDVSKIRDAGERLGTLIERIANQLSVPD